MARAGTVEYQQQAPAQLYDQRGNGIRDEARLREIVTETDDELWLVPAIALKTPHDPPGNPDEVTDAVGIDVGILKYVHDSDGTAVESPDVSDERERWNALNVTSRGKNTARTTGRSNARRSLDATPT